MTAPDRQYASMASKRPDPKAKRKGRILEVQTMILPLLLAIIGFLVTWRISSSADQKLEVLIAVSAFVIGALFVLLQRLYTLEDQLGIEREIHRHEFLAEKLRQIAGRFKNIEEIERDSPALKEEAIRVIGECVLSLSKLAEGTFDVRDYPDRMLRCDNHVEEAKIIIRATSYVASYWWTSAPGMNYSEANYKAVARNCVVRRVFILPKQQFEEWRAGRLNDSIKSVMDEQHSKNIEVYVALDDEVDAPQRQLYGANLLICDQTVATWNKDTPDGTLQGRAFTPMPATFTYNKDEIRDKTGYFDALVRCSHRYPLAKQIPAN